jgi:glycosidase
MPPEQVPELGPMQTRSCSLPVKVDARLFQRSHCDKDVPSSITSVALAGEFNQWKPVDALKDDDGDQVWTLDFKTGAGAYGYKYVLNGNTWCTDPSNPTQKYVGGVANSLLEVPDCKRPLLVLERLSAPAGAGSIEADVRLMDGSEKKGFVPSDVTVSMNGEPLQKGLQVLADGRILIRLSGLSEDRYTFRIEAKDASGNAAKRLYFYTWVEKTRFRWSDATLYFVFVDRFVNGDKSNDGPIGGVSAIANYQGGDLQGVLDKLKDGYFTKLGVNALWLSPLYANPNQAQKGPDGRLYAGYHGYWPIAPRTIQPRYGDWALLRKLVREAHKQGIRVLVDLASNHVHTEHPYWKQHQNAGWFHSFNSCAPAWDKPITCWFDAFLPDINYSNWDVASQMVDDAVYWAQEGELDGFRVDAVKHMRKIVLYNTRKALDQQVTHGHQHFYLVGETFTGGWKGGGDLIKEFISTSMLTGQFDFPLYWEILGTLGRRESGFGFQRLDSMIKDSLDKQFYGAQSVMSNFIGNHDVPRFVSHAAGQISNMWSGDRNRAWDQPPSQPTNKQPYQRLRVAWTLLMALPGVPLIYYGDEIGLAGETDPDNRRAMVWSGLSGEQTSVRAHLQQLGQLRRTYPALRSDKRRTLFVDGERYAFLREGTTGSTTQRIIVAIRRSGGATFSIPVSGLAKDGDSVKDLLRNKTLTVASGAIQIQLNEDEGTYLLLP